MANAISDVLPDAEHGGAELKDRFWACSWSTFEEEFRDNLDLLSKRSRAAALYVMNYPTHTWVRAHFTPRCRCWMVDNNAAECLNSWILELRFLPIIRLFDGIQMKMFKKWGESEKLASKWKADYSPKCMELFEANRYLAVGCQVAFNGSEGYEIREGRNVHTVNLRTERCSCRAWDLTGHGL